MYAAAGNPRRTPPSGKKTIYGWTLSIGWWRLVAIVWRPPGDTKIERPGATALGNHFISTGLPRSKKRTSADGRFTLTFFTDKQ